MLPAPAPEKNSPLAWNYVCWAHVGWAHVGGADVTTGSKPIAGSITTEHRYELPIKRSAVWALISDTDAYQSWWTWLRKFEAPGLQAGAEWRCEVQPPVPYPVRFRVVIEEIMRASFVRARVEGDVIGQATLTLTDDPTGCVALLASSLAPGSATLRLVSRLAAPVARFGHDYVLDSGARLFIARAITPTLPIKR
jgi:uncharacterized protein YndB with AHSA1/START domain